MIRAAAARPLRRNQRLILGATVALLVAGIVQIAVVHPTPVFVAMLVTIAVVSIALYPVAAVFLLLFFVPFHSALYFAINKRAHVATGSLDYWKDALTAAVFLRAVIGRFAAERRLRLPANPADTFMLLYVFAYIALAVHSPNRPTVIRALARDTEGPVLFLAIMWLRPTRRQLWACAGLMVAAATIMGGAALFERLGPHAGFLTFYGAKAPPMNSSFYVSGGSYRAGSFLDSPLTLAFFSAGMTPFVLALTFGRSRWRIPAAVAFVAVFSALLVTVTRSGYIGGAVGSLLVIGLLVRNPRIRYALIALILVAAGSVALAYVSRGSATLIRPSGNPAHLAKLERDLRNLEARPLGYGLGTTDALVQRFELQGVPGATESTFMAKALEGGIQGLFLYLTALFVTFMRLRNARLRARLAGDDRAAALIAGAMGAMVGVALSGLFLGISELPVEFVLWGPPAIALAMPLVRGRTLEPAPAT